MDSLRGATIRWMFVEPPVIGMKFVGFVTFDSVADANKAARILAEVGHERPPLATVRR